MEKTENPENSDVSEPAESEQEEGTEGEETPVIDEENNSEDNQEEIGDNAGENEEEPPVETPVDSDAGASIMSVDGMEPMAITEHKVTVAESTDYAVAFTKGVDAANMITTGAATDGIEFTVTPAEHKTIKSVKWKVGEQGTDAELNGTVVENTDAKTYTIASDNLTDTAITADIVLTIEVEAKTYTVTVTKSDTGIKKATYLLTKDNTEPGEENTELGANLAVNDSTSNLKIYVEPDAGYSVTVKKGDVIYNGHNNVYNLGCITKDVEVSIQAEKTGYEVKSSVVRASSETTDTITDAVLNAVKVKWGKMVTVSGEEGAETYTVLKRYSNLTFTLEGLGDLKAAVYYGGTGTQTTLVEPQNGTYTVSMDDVAATEGFTVKVEVRNVGKSKITMAANTDVKELSYKNDAGAYVAIGEGPEIKEDQKFEFKVEANEFFKVAKVAAATASGEEVAVSKAVDGEDTVYSLVATNENITITVTTELDATQCYQLQMNVDGDEGSVTAAVTKTADGTEADDPALNGSLPAEDPIVTRNAKVQVVLTVDSHYTLATETPVKLGTETLTAKSENTYELTLTKGALATLTVTTERKGLDAANTVTFDKEAAEHMELVVTEVADKVTKDPANANKYNLAAGVKDVDFIITADGPFTPVVQYSTNKEVKPNGTPVKKDGKTTYTYSLAAVLLGTDDTITITEEDSIKKVTVLYDAEDVNVTMKKGATEEGPTDIDGGVEASVTEGDILTITASALDNCTLDTITEKVGTGEAANLEGFTKGVVFHKFNVTAEDDVTIVITSKKQLSVQPLFDEDAQDFMSLNRSKKYDVRYDGTYTARIKNGAVDLALQKVELKKGNDLVPQTSDEGVINWSTDFDKGHTWATITFGEGLAGAECTLLLYDDAAGDAPVASYPLKVSALVADKDVKINSGKDISQTADTVNTYKVAVTANASASELHFEIPTGDANKDVVRSAVINDDGMLKITTGFGAGESTELKVYTYASDRTKKYVQQGGKDLTVKVTATALLDKDKTVPTVKQASSTDVSLTLSLGAKKVAAPENGKVYYEVKLTPSYVEADHKNKLLQTVPVQYIEKNGDAQEATVYVGAQGTAVAPAYGTGAACQYGIAVRLVHSDTAAANGTNIDHANVKSESKSFTKDAGKDFATKNPTFETNLKLKKGAGNVYTTQKDVVIATPTFSKDTSYTVLPDDGASDITMGLKSNQQLEIKVEDNQIKATATANTALGKHTIQVLATTTVGDTMYASRATIVVTVVRGIEDIKLTVPTTSIYYADKAVNLKTALAFNSGYTDNPKNGVPKTKKVEYKLVDVSETKSGLNTLESIQNAAEAGVVKDGVKIDKNGKISVPKNYKVTADSKFKVLVKAADFAENMTYDLSEEITITRDYMQIAKALIVKSNADGDGYDVIDAEGKELNASELNGAQMMAFESGLPARTSYTLAEVNGYQITENVTYASSNKKAVEINDHGYITVNAPAKNVKLTVAPADGSAADRKLNTTKTITTTVKYDEVTELGLEIVKLNSVNGDNTPEKTFEVDEVEKAAADVAREITYNDSSAATFMLTLKTREESGWEDATLFTDYKLAVTKGKVLAVDKESGYIDTLIAANDQQTTLKLTYKVYNAEKKKYDSKTKEYKLTNTGLTAAVSAKTKAPKVVFRNKRNTIQANYTTTDKNLETWEKENGSIEIGHRYIGFNLQPNGKDYPLDFVGGKDAEGNDLYVKVDVDWSVMTAKNMETLQTLAENMNPKGYRKLNSDGNYGGYVHMTFNDETLTPGSYKLKVSVGTVDDNRDFVPAAPSTAITIKVAKDKALSFKPVTSYKISAKDNGYAVLTGKGSYDKVTFSDLQNDNTVGKVKGRENKFRDYFELASDSNGNQILQLKDSCFVDNKLVDISKDDLTGYVTYKAEYNYTDTDSTIKGTTKITVKLEGNTIAKYAVTNATADTAASAVANVTVTCNKKPVEIAYALVKEADKGTWQVVTKAQTWAPAIEVNGSVISLQHAAAMTDKSAKVTILVIPADSYYTTKIGAVTDDADNAKKKAIIEQYGVELKTTITLNDLSAAGTNKRISVDKANLTQKFTAKYTEYANGAESGWYTTDRNYWIDVPYTELYDDATAQIITIRSDKEWINFNKNTEGGKNRISIVLNKDELQEHFDDCYQKKTVKGSTVYQPKKLNVNATVYYGGTQETPAAPSDTFRFALTMPEEPYFMNATDEEGNIVTDYDLAIARVKELEQRISQSIADNMQKYNYYYMQELSGDELNESVKGHVKQHLEDHIRSWLGDDCGVDLDNLQQQMTVATGSGEFKAPTSTAAGLVKVTVALTNGNDKQVDDTTKKTENVTFTVNLAPFGAQATDVTTLVNAFFDQATITNKTTEASLLADLKAYVKENANYDTSKIRYTITDWNPTPASVGTPGSLALKVEIYNIADGGEPEIVDKTADDAIVIPALESAGNVVTAVKKAVGVEEPDTGTTADVIKELTKTNNETKARKAVEDAAKKAIGANPYVVVFAKKEGTETDDFTFEPAKKDAPGSLSFKLVVKNEDGTALEGSTGDVVLTNAAVAAIADLLTLTEAEEKVNAWITANTLAETDNASTDTKVLKNGVTKDVILTAIKSDTTNKVPETSLIVVTFEDDFKCIDATVNAAGSVTGTLVLTDMADATKRVALDVVIPALPQTEAEAVQKIKGAVANAVKKGIIVVTKDTQNEDETVTNAILTAARSAAGLKANTFDITVKDSAKLTVTAPNGGTPGKATITLLVKAKTNGVGADCEIEIEIPGEAAPTP